MSIQKSSVSHPLSGQEMVEWPRHLGDPAKEKSWDTFGLGLGGFIYMVSNHFHVRMSPCQLSWWRNVLQQRSYQPLAMRMKHPQSACNMNTSGGTQPQKFVGRRRSKLEVHEPVAGLWKTP